MSWDSYREQAAQASRIVVTVVGGMQGKRKTRPAPLFIADTREERVELGSLIEIDRDQEPVDVMTLGRFELHFVDEGPPRLVLTYLGDGWVRTRAGDWVVRQPDALDRWFGQRVSLP